MSVLSPRKVLRPVLERAFKHFFQPKPPYKPAQLPKDDRENATALDLVQAIEQNNEREVVRLLRQGVDPQVMTRAGQLALVRAVETNRLPLAKILVEAGADPRTPDSAGRTALGMLWLDANGGKKLDPTINPAATGQARELYQSWVVRFPVGSRNDYFSPTYRDNVLTSAQHARLELESDWKPGVLVNENTTGLPTQWEKVESFRSLSELQQLRRARLIPEPAKDLGVGSLPPAHRR